MIRTAHEVLGRPVRDGNGEPLGDIEELVVEPLSGRVAYALVALGNGDERRDYLPVPWAALASESTGDAFVLPLPHRRLRQAPGFAADDWPDLDDRGWGLQIYTFYGLQPYWERAPEARA